MCVDLFWFRSYALSTVRAFKVNVCRPGEVQDKWRKGVGAAASSGAFQMLCKGCESILFSFFFKALSQRGQKKVPVVSTRHLLSARHRTENIRKTRTQTWCKSANEGRAEASTVAFRGGRG